MACRRHRSHLMRGGLIAIVAAVSLATSAAAAPAPSRDEAEVLAVVDRFFAALSTADATAVAGLVTTEGMIQAQSAAPDGTFKLRRVPMSQWVEHLRGQAGFRERIWDPIVLRRGPIAVVWAPYELVHDKGGHCGVDVFDLIQTDAGWKIDNLTWTAEPAACAELKATQKK